MRLNALLMIYALIAMIVVACSPQSTVPATIQSDATEASTLLPSNTPTALPSITPTMTPTATTTPTLVVDLTQQAIDQLPLVTVEPVVNTNLTAPITIDLPEDWIVDYEMAAIPMPFEDSMDLLPFSAYHGPVTGGEGYIIYLWGFSNVLPAFPLEGDEDVQVNLWADGFRLLVTFVLQPDCRVGRDPERTFAIGDFEAIGGYFWAVDCGKMFTDDDIPESPDVQGWFAGFQEQGVNFMFYAYVEPREAIAGPAREELQAILDTVRVDFSLLEIVEEEN